MISKIFFEIKNLLLFEFLTMVKKDLIIRYSILLLPFSLVFSIFISELILFILMLFYVKDNFKHKQKINSLFIFFLISYFFYISISSVYLFENFRITSPFFNFRFLLYGAAIFYYLNYYKLYEILIKSFILISIVLIIDAIFQFSFGYNIIGLPLINGNRVSSFFDDELILGSFLIRLLPFFLIFFILNFKNKNKTLITYLFFLSFVIVLSGERTALFLLIFFIIITFFQIPNVRKVIFLSLIFFVFLITLLVNFNSNYYERYLYNTLNSFGVIKEADGKFIKSLKFFDENDKLIKPNIFSQQHQDHYVTAYMMFKDNKLFGHGTKSFRILCKEPKYRISKINCATHPHNITMQFLSELGLIGISFLIIFHFYLFSELFKISNLKVSKIEKKVLILSLIGVLVNVFPLIPSGNFFNNWLSIILMLNLTNYLFLKNKFLNA
ncbi:MAG: hypothetical protein CBD97_02470 [Pelagibacteraceae bacterium TMED237]|nr:MAG: hypothetical protein CBD97_02470 [Pelagibacteraceae bacterium TMED237]